MIGNSGASCGGTMNDIKAKDPMDRYTRPGGLDTKIS